MLLGNYSVLLKSPARFRSGATVSDNRSNYNTSSAHRAAYFGGWSPKAHTPEGYVDGWVLAQQGGGMATFVTIIGSAVASGAIAGGRNASADLTGSGTVTDAALGLILSAVADLVGSGTVSADVVGKLEAAADLVGSAAVAAALGALAGAAADLTGSASVSASARADATISADIVVTGELLNTANVAAAVWGAMAAAYNAPGTTGNKLNSASAAGDPWTAELPGTYTDGSAGKILGELINGLTPEQLVLLTDLAKIHGLILGESLIVTPTTRAAGDVEQTIETVGDMTIVERV